MKKLIFVICLFLNLKTNAQQSDFKHISFKKADSIANICKNERLNNLPILAHKLTFKLKTKVEKFRAIHTWVCSNIEIDYDFYTENTKKRKKLKNDSLACLNWNNAFKTKVFKTLLNEQKTICTGYAYLVKELASLAGLHCKIINGYGRTINSNINKLDIANHSWNAVKLNNKWYLSDPTWSSGFFNIEENKFIKDYNNGYFLAEPKLFIRNHYPLEKAWTLIDDDSPTVNQFVKGPVVYGNTFKHQIILEESKQMTTQVFINEAVFFKFKILNKNKADNISLVINDGTGGKAMTPSNFKYEKGILEFKHSFDKKGVYDVHLKILEDVVVSYTIKVVKNKRKSYS